MPKIELEAQLSHPCSILSPHDPCMDGEESFRDTLQSKKLCGSIISSKDLLNLISIFSFGFLPFLNRN